MRTSDGFTRRALAVAGAASLIAPTEAAAATRRVQFWATQSGKRTEDAVDGSGNPYATLLVYLMAVSTEALPQFAEDLRARTMEMTGGDMKPETVPARIVSRWRLNPPARAERRAALVLTLSDYSASGQLSLPGAELDSRRVSRAFESAGFVVTRAHNPSRSALPGVLEDFARASRGADVAAIYGTGHGVEVDGVQYVLHRDHRFDDGRASLARAVRWEEVARCARARRLNLTFWAGCRDNPFA